MTLLARTTHGVTWVAAGEIARQAAQLLVGIVLARLLTPADFGLVAMAMFVIGCVDLFGRCGLTEALIQRPDCTDGDWSSVYWAGLALGALVGGAVWALAPLAADFYRDDRVTPIVQAAGWTGFLASLGATQAAWYTKQMQFRTIAAVEGAGVVIGGSLGVVMALVGWGVWSLVASLMVSSASTSCLLHFMCPWRPGLTVRPSTLRRAFRFGVGLQGFGIVNYLNRHLDDALIGRYIGPAGLGHYGRAYQLMLYPVQNIAGVVGRVMFPALCEISDDLPRFRAAYLKAVSAIATVSFPAMLGLLVVAAEAIPVVYGPQWVPAVPVLRVLCLVGLAQSVATTVGWIYLTRARTGLMMAWGTGAAVVICAAFIAGLPWGILGVAVAYAVTTGILLVPCLAIPFRLVGLSLLDLVRAVRAPLAGALLMAAVVAMIRGLLLSADFPTGGVLGVSVVSGIFTYLGWLWLSDDSAVRHARAAWAAAVATSSSPAVRGASR